MGESDRYKDYQEYRSRRRNILLGQGDNALVWLFAINVIFFLILLFVQVSYFFSGSTPDNFQSGFLQWFQLPASVRLLSERPWTLVTYMFAHFSVMQLLSNILWIWAFGSILQDLTGNRKVIPVYIYGGLMGALFFILANYLIPPLRSHIADSFTIGGNASAMAIAIATTMLAPGYRFFRMLNGGIPIWVLTLIYVLIDFAGIASYGAAYSLSHIGGAFAGFLFVVLLRRGWDGSVWMNRLYSWIINLFTPKQQDSPDTEKQKVYYNTGNRQPFTRSANITQQRVDAILDKISQEGYASLTDEEKKILKRASEEDL